MAKRLKKLIYALKDGNIVSIADVPSGKKCGCVCPACGGELIAHKGQKRMHHFKHHSNEDCEYGYESSLHLAAKDILSRSEKMVIPPVYIERTRNHFLIHSSVLLNLFLFSWASRLGFWSFDDTVSEMGFLEPPEENK